MNRIAGKQVTFYRPALQTVYVMNPWHALKAWRSALWDERM